MKNKIYIYSPKYYDEIANDVMENSILLGCHQGLTLINVDVIFTKFKKF